MTTKTLNELRQIPRPGQFLMYVDLTALQTVSTGVALTRLEGMGYAPQLRYQEASSGLRLYALLRDEQFEASYRFPDTYRVDEKIALFEAFPGDEMAVSCANGLPAKVVEMIAA